MASKSFCTVLFSMMIALGGCGGESGSAGEAAASNGGAGDSRLTSVQLEHGIGPIEAFELGELDADMAVTGRSLFEIKCSACHKFDQRYVGPSLGGVLERRSPAFVMNMILNPEEMLAKHPEAKALLTEFMTPMANQNLTEDEARAIVEYFRVAGQEGS